MIINEQENNEFKNLDKDVISMMKELFKVKHNYN